MSIQALNWVFKQHDLHNSAAKFVLTVLANYSDEDGRCYPSQATIAKLTAMSDRGVRNQVTWLVQHGYITVTKRRTAAHQGTDIYQLEFEAEKVSSEPLKRLRQETEQAEKISTSQPEEISGSRRNTFPVAGGKEVQKQAEYISANTKALKDEPSEETHKPLKCVSDPPEAVQEPEPGLDPDPISERAAFVGREYRKLELNLVTSVPEEIPTAFGPYRDALEDWYCSVNGIVSLPPNAATMTQINWLFESKFTLEEIKAFYQHAKSENWRSGSVNLSAIVKGIGEWRAAKKQTASAAPAAIDFSWCKKGCDPSNGMIEIDQDGRKAWTKCDHAREKQAA